MRKLGFFLFDTLLFCCLRPVGESGTGFVFFFCLGVGEAGPVVVGIGWLVGWLALTQSGKAPLGVHVGLGRAILEHVVGLLG